VKQKKENNKEADTMTTITCDHCGKAMTKRGVLFMSNSKFEVYRCSCGNERKVCVGLANP
jgi:hypothetical protein